MTCMVSGGKKKWSPILVKLCFLKKAQRIYKTFKILVTRGLIGLQVFEQGQNDWCKIHLQILVTQTAICSVQKTLNCSGILEIEVPEFWAHGCVLKISDIPWNVHSRRLCNPGDLAIWRPCQSKVQHGTCDSLNRFSFHQSRHVKSHHEIGKCAATLYTWDVTPQTFWGGVGWG